MMERSESIAALAAALAKAQGVMDTASKDSKNPYFNSSYADLASVWEACRGPLSDNGLSVIQLGVPTGTTAVRIKTILAHSSGEWIGGEMEATPTKQGPQEVGSCTTYLRRYGLQAMVGIAPEDDDGNAAQGNKDQAVTKKKEQFIAEPTPEKDAPAKNYRFLKTMGEEKKRIGDEMYYKILGAAGFEHASDIHDRDTQKAVYATMKGAVNVA